MRHGMARGPDIALDSTVVASADQLSCELDGEVLVLSLSTGAYHGLDEVAARVWNEIQEPRTVRTVRDVLVQTYDVTPDRCATDLLGLLDELRKRGLVECTAEGSRRVD